MRIYSVVPSFEFTFTNVFVHIDLLKDARLLYECMMCVINTTEECHGECTEHLEKRVWQGGAQSVASLLLQYRILSETYCRHQLH